MHELKEIWLLTIPEFSRHGVIYRAQYDRSQKLMLLFVCTHVPYGLNSGYLSWARVYSKFQQIA